MNVGQPISSPSSASPGKDSGPGKLAEQVARRIQEHIHARNLPIGHPLGREADLNALAGVSRWTFREALSLLEQSGLVTMRRGANGGIFVAAPMLDAVCNGLASYLEFVHAAPAHVTGTLRALHGHVLERAPDCLDAQDREALASLAPIVARPDAEGFDAIIGAQSVMMGAIGNPALRLFTATLMRMLDHAAWYSTLDDAAFHGVFPGISAAYRNVVEAVLERDRQGARAQADVVMDAYFVLFEASFAGGRLAARPGATERAYRLHPPSRPTKKAERVARELSEMISDAGWRPGMNLGSERELMARFEVGRSVLREAIRSLERLGAVVMGRGGASGLTVISPDPLPVIETSRRYLAREGMTPSHAAEVTAVLDAAGPAGEVAGLFRAVLSP
ncbi:MAG TPA: GntR family transcriptional regulator [Novosphingobium sp.]|nr:GntR family transcriptional regulator [Novosphingobium sp.]